jgi:hypothetical protein
MVIYDLASFYLEYLSITAPKTYQASEFGHVIRVARILCDIEKQDTECEVFFFSFPCFTVALCGRGVNDICIDVAR